MAALHHPGIVDVYDVGEEPGDDAYLVMARVNGQSLDRRIAEHGRLPVAETMSIVAQVAQQCGQRTLVRWEPAFERLVLERVDDHVAHAGGQDIALAGETSGRLPEHDGTWLRSTASRTTTHPNSASPARYCRAGEGKTDHDSMKSMIPVSGKPRSGSGVLRFW